MESIWQKTVKTEKRPSLAGNLETDILIIGAGMTGILTGYLLTETGRKVTIIDAGEAGGGQTGNTTAKITSQHNLIYDKLIQKFGKEQAHQYAMANQNAIEEYKRIIEKEKIDCDFYTCKAYLYSERESECLKREETAAKELGIEAEFTTDTELPRMGYESIRQKARKDETGNVYLVSAICPHLGCELEWNPEEKSWDCPCHGSRFDYKGKLLDGPAQKNIVQP